MKDQYIHDMAYISISVAIMAICSWIKIPFVIPFTLQTFAVFIVLMIFGGKNGTISILLYIFMGAVGIPVFSGFTSGFGVLLGTTGGYIWGFIIIGILYWVFEKLINKHRYMNIVILILGLIICYSFGTWWFIIVYTESNGEISLLMALSWCVFPFLLPDMVKLFLAKVIADRVKPFIKF